RDPEQASRHSRPRRLERVGGARRPRRGGSLVFPAVHGVVSQGGKAAAPPSTEKTGVASWTTPGSGLFELARSGWVFQVGASAITVRKLRHFKFGSSAATWRVMIHRNADSAVMAQADIVFGSNENDIWKEGSVMPVQLAAGETYTVSSRPVSGN